MHKLILTAALLSTAGYASAEEREWQPFRDFADKVYLTKFQSVAPEQRDKVQFLVTLKPANPAIKLSDVAMAVVAPGERVPFQIGADGTVFVPYKAKWVQDDSTKIVTNQPKGEKMQISVGMAPLMQEGSTWSYTTLLGSVQQANTLMKNQAGMLSLFAPKFKAISLQFSKPTQVKLVTRAGERVLNTDAKHALLMKPDDALLAENAKLILSERPKKVDFDTDG